MGTNLRTLAAAGVFCGTLWASDTALAQNRGASSRFKNFSTAKLHAARHQQLTDHGKRGWWGLLATALPTFPAPTPRYIVSGPG